MDTIFAPATAQGRAGVSVIRISGPDAAEAATALAGDMPAPRKMGLRFLRDAGGVMLDQALVVWFPGPGSFTGEDVVEFHVHGSIAVVSAVLNALGQTGARIAEPGEFTRRALDNDKMDLAQVEALGDLIVAETESQRQQAMGGLSGRLSEAIETWRTDLIRAAALIEATIDFADEDVPVDVTGEVRQLLDRTKLSIRAALDGFNAAERVRLGFEVAIVGAPNVGKSTLLNVLAQRDAAITSHVAGTTRDVIEVRMDLDGLAVTLLDTAGLREGQDEIETEGIARALARAEAADLRIILAEPGEVLPIELRDDDILRAPKGDVRNDKVAAISGKTGLGVQELVQDVTQTLAHKAQDAGLATHERHRQAMAAADGSLTTAMDMLRHGPERYDIAAEEIRTAIRGLEAVIGRIDVENLLDEIFSSFCLGK
ncbi:MAG: tRNA uridine-5-carboxymethylaminomethyl(34) synthesis GTPase MnmE [Pseudomonadota bacterium]